jgi:salicylate hydroxylase
VTAGRPRVVIAGAGIGGLTAALALSQAGCGVHVLERAGALTEVGAGLQLSPNATRVLRRLGVLDIIRLCACAPEALRIRRGRDGHLLALAPLGDSAARRWGAPTLLAHRADVQSALLGAVMSRPAIMLTLGAPVTGYRETADGVRVAVQAAGADDLEGDLLVGADGLHSLVRAALRGPDRAVSSGRSAWRAMIDARALPSHLQRPETNLWLGHRAHLVHYPLRGGTLINVVAIADGEIPDMDGRAELWNAPGSAAVLAGHFGAWCAEARQLIAAGADWRVWPLADRAPLRSWSSGRVTLVGDAAHPMLPFLAQGAAQAIEDAAALADAVAECGTDIAAALRAYEGRRVARATRVQRESRRQARVYHLSGAMALARDAVMRGLGPTALLRRYDWLYGHPA